MTKPLLQLADVGEICLAPFLIEACGRELSRDRDEARDNLRSQGVAWSGAGGAKRRTSRSPDEIRDMAEAALARARAFANSPRGRFLVCLRGLQEAGYAGEAEAARTAFARGFAAPDRPACVVEIAAALGLLARIPRPAAREACRALADLLTDALEAAGE